MKAPERRHLRAGTKSLGIAQPKRNPFLTQLQSDVFEIRTDLLLILLQVTRLQIQLVDAGRQLAILHAQRFGVSQQWLGIAGVGTGIRVESRLPLIRSDLLLQLRNLLARVGQRVGFAIESFHAMTADTATLVEQIFPEVQSVCALSYPVIRVAHLATRLSVL